MNGLHYSKAQRVRVAELLRLRAVCSPTADIHARLVSLAMLKNTTRRRFTAGDCSVSRHRG
uniref:Uncharacterized protein n=1 Tax=Myoviridae sp. ct7Mg7 TaxID=2827661 RepID=A0A8S5SNP4_9CAUD|nr:MAG TPA: hypothetical protein [Myoviridae sp. ct7Mg7]